MSVEDASVIALRVGTIADILFSLTDAPLVRIDCADAPALSLWIDRAQRMFEAPEVADKEDHDTILQTFGLTSKHVAEGISRGLRTTSARIVARRVRGQPSDPDLLPQEYMFSRGISAMATSQSAKRRRLKVGDVLRRRVLMLDETAEADLSHPLVIWTLIQIELAAEDSAYRIFPPKLINAISEHARRQVLLGVQSGDVPLMDQVVLCEAALAAGLPRPLPEALQSLRLGPLAGAPRYGFIEPIEQTAIPSEWMRLYLFAA